MTRITAIDGLAIEQHASPNAGGKMTDHRGLVLHIAEGTFRGTIAWQNNPEQRYADGTRVTTSSTFIVGRKFGEWAQMVDADRVAWCQRGGSYEWLSVELEGHAPDVPSPWQIEACARLLAWAHGQYAIPIQTAAHPKERGLGHHAMDREWMGEEWGHDACPGVGVVTSKAVIVARALELIEERDMPTPEDIWGVEYQDYVTNEAGVKPAINMKHAVLSARRDAHYARRGTNLVQQHIERVLSSGGFPVTLTDAQLDALAERVAARLGALQFVPSNVTDEGDVLGA
jgi:hypothetical protein